MPDAFGIYYSRGQYDRNDGDLAALGFPTEDLVPDI